MTNKYGIQKIPDVFQCTDYREKYWGWIKTCTATEDFTLKHIFMNKGSQSSLEYHVKKDENYYILSGEIQVGIRIGRAENKAIILTEGEVFHIPPGLMHMRIALNIIITFHFPGYYISKTCKILLKKERILYQNIL